MKAPLIFVLFSLVLLGAGCAPSSPFPEPMAITPEPTHAEPLHLPTPEEVRGIYWTGQTAGTKRADELLAYMTQTGLNAAVIDLKMDNGQLAFAPNDVSLAPYAMAKPAIKDLEALLLNLKAQGIYRIARIAVMRDSAYAAIHPDLAFHYAGGSLWRDNTGAAWVDPAAADVAEYAVALGKEAYARGFDEVQFDYVRFASDGKLSSIRYPVYDGKKTKVAVMQEFFKTVGGAMKADKIPVSFDVFGMTYETNDDFNIGQRLIDVYPEADWVSPMTYPSHYANGFMGYKNPALFPYEVPKHSFDSGAAILLKELGIPESESRSHTRPWIQDFDIGAIYTAARIEAQIKAVRDAGASGWMIWNARNVYEPARYVP